MKKDKIIEWFGASAGIAGALLLAINTAASKFGWILFLLSNAAWLLYALRKNIKSIFTMQLVFAGTSLLGVYRWLI